MGGWMLGAPVSDEACEHDFELTSAHVDGYRLRQTRTCRWCGAVEYVPSVGDYAAGDVTYEGRQPLFSRRDAHDPIG